MYSSEQMAFSPTYFPTYCAPAFEVKETQEAYIFKCDVPGFKESELDITLACNRLTFSGKREEENMEQGAVCYQRERTYGYFCRCFTLPEGCDKDQVHADLACGVLTVAVTKRHDAQAKKISVKSSRV